jgi:hypothetical protein
MPLATAFVFRTAEGREPDSQLTVAHAQHRLTDCLHDINEREIAFWERGSTASRLGHQGFTARFEPGWTASP